MGRSAWLDKSIEQDLGQTFAAQPNEQDLTRSIERFLKGQEPEFRSKLLVQVAVVTKSGKQITAVANDREQALHNLLPKIVRDE